MNVQTAFWILTAGACLGISGCGNSIQTGGVDREPVVAEDVIFSVTYQKGDGTTAGFTRVNQSAAVPASEGSWNVDARGRLTSSFLIITYPQKGLGPHIIPTHRLVDVQFGTGGIESVADAPSGGSVAEAAERAAP